MQNNLPTQSGFVLKGEIGDLSDGSEVTLQYGKTTLTTKSKANTFLFEGKVDRPVQAIIRTNEGMVTVVLENTRITLECDSVEEMRLHSQIEGGYEQSVLNEMMHFYQADFRLRKKQYTDDEEKQQLQTYLAQYGKEPIYRVVAKKHPNSLLGSELLFANRAEIGREALALLYEQMSPQYQDSPAGRGIQFFLSNEVLQVGDRCPSFQVQTIQGEDFNLTQLMGRYAYLIFWGANCGGCRSHNKYVKANLHRFPPEVQVVSFYLGNNVASWEKASTEDQITWLNLSDLATGFSQIQTLFGVQAVPNAFLINDKGILIGKKLRTRPNFFQNLQRMIKKDVY